MHNQNNIKTIIVSILSIVILISVFNGCRLNSAKSTQQQTKPTPTAVITMQPTATMNNHTAVITLQPTAIVNEQQVYALANERLDCSDYSSAFSLFKQLKKKELRDAFIDRAYTVIKDRYMKSHSLKDLSGLYHIYYYRDVQQIIHRHWRLQSCIGLTYYAVGLKDGKVVLSKGECEDTLGLDKCLNWTGIVSIETYGNKIIGIKADGTAVSVGWNRYDQIELSQWRDIVQVDCDWRTNIGLKKDGTIVARGFADGYEFGTAFKVYEQFTDIVMVEIFNDDVFGLKSDGTVIIDSASFEYEGDFSNFKNIVMISAGEYHVAGLKNDGTVVATGCNENGECNVSQWRDIVAVYAYYGYTVGLKKDGTLVYTGKDEYEYILSAVKKWKNIVAVSVLGNNIIGLKKDGTVVCTGENFDNQNVAGWTDIGR